MKKLLYYIWSIFLATIIGFVFYFITFQLRDYLKAFGYDVLLFSIVGLVFILALWLLVRKKLKYDIANINEEKSHKLLRFFKILIIISNIVTFVPWFGIDAYSIYFLITLFGDFPLIIPPLFSVVSLIYFLIIRNKLITDRRKITVLIICPLLILSCLTMLYFEYMFFSKIGTEGFGGIH